MFRKCWLLGSTTGMSLLLLLALVASASSVWGAARETAPRVPPHSSRVQTAHVQDPPATAEPAEPALEQAEMVFEEPAEFYEVPTGMPYVPLHFRPFYFRAEYLSWWVQGADLPPLVTTATVSATPTAAERAQAGVLGQTGTQVLFGGQGLDDDLHSGQRFTLGLWMDPGRFHAVEGSYFSLGSETIRFSASDASNRVLARPYFNVETGNQDVEFVAFPNLVSGRIDIAYSTELEGAEVVYRQALMADYGTRWDFLCGYRYARLQDRLTITESLKSLATDGPLAVGTTIDMSDVFDTASSFHGGEFGLAMRQQWRRVALDSWFKVALGGTTSRVQIAGQTTKRVPTPNVAPVTTANGLLAQPTNSGTFEATDFSTIPEVGVTLRWNLTRCLRATLGYSCTYWSNVARASRQIDPQLNLSQVPPETLTGAARPEFNLNSSGLWVQGLNVGLDLRY